MSKYIRKKDGIFRGNDGRLYEHRRYSVKLYWSGDMLSYLKRHFHNTKNKELAEILRVSTRTIIRKARQLGLSKSRQWLLLVRGEGCRLALAEYKRLGCRTSFKKGHIPHNKKQLTTTTTTINTESK